AAHEVPGVRCRYAGQARLGRGLPAQGQRLVCDRFQGQRKARREEGRRGVGGRLEGRGQGRRGERLQGRAEDRIQGRGEDRIQERGEDRIQERGESRERDNVFRN